MCACFKFKSNAFTLELLLYKSYTIYIILLKLKEELIEAPNVSSFLFFLGFFFNPCTVLAELIWRMSIGMIYHMYLDLLYM